VTAVTEVVVEADGGSRGNPGPAGYGSVVRDAATGAVLAERFAGLGVTTNNVAEYQGLIAGLRAAAELGARQVRVRMDSKLVVEQMSGRWKVKHPAMQPLAVAARDLAAGFDRISYEWIPREQNKHADRLANQAMDEQAAPTAITVDPAPAVEEPAGLFAAPNAPASSAASAASWSGATGTPTRLLLLRHGQTEYSVQRRYSGRGDLPLTPVGLAQARAAATRLATVPDIAAVVCSPLARARQTAQAVADATGAPLTTDPGLLETDFGRWEGLTFTEAAERDPQVHGRWLADPSTPAPGGESFDQVAERVRGTLDDLVRRHAGRTVVVVSHVTPIKTLLRFALDVGPALLFRLHLDLASLSIADFYPDGHTSVRLVNDTSHLG
jgi:broad specificity phosphatase PhoE/ribonuclease HI